MELNPQILISYGTFAVLIGGVLVAIGKMAKALSAVTEEVEHLRTKVEKLDEIVTIHKTDDRKHVNAQYQKAIENRLDRIENKLDALIALKRDLK